MAYTLARCLLILSLGLALGGLGYAGARRSKAWAFGLAGVGLAALLFHYADPRIKLDQWMWLPGGLFRDVLFAPGSLLVGVALAKARDSARERVLTGLLAVGYALFLLHDPGYVLLSARENLSAAMQIKDGVVLQRNDRNCVPASTTTVLRRWGLELDEGELALRAQTSYYGTSSHRLLAAIDALAGASGLEAVRVRATWEELRAMDHPCVLWVRLLQVTPHAVALLALDGEALTVGEPAAGRQRFDVARFEVIKPWDGWVTVIGRDIDHWVAPGGRSPKVAELREVLGLKPSEDSERLDPAFAEALRRFQQERGLPSTGALDVKTIVALHAVRDRGRIPSLSVAAVTSADETGRDRPADRR